MDHDTSISYLHTARTQMKKLLTGKVFMSAFLSAWTMRITACSKHKTDHKAPQNFFQTSSGECKVHWPAVRPHAGQECISIS